MVFFSCSSSFSVVFFNLQMNIAPRTTEAALHIISNIEEHSSSVICWLLVTLSIDFCWYNSTELSMLAS